MLFHPLFDQIWGFGVVFDEIEVQRLTFSRKRVHGRFGWPLGAQHNPPHHAPGRPGLHFGRVFSIKDRSKIDVFFDTIFDMIFDRFLEAFWIKH